MGGDWLWGQRMLIHLTLLPTSQSRAHSQSGGWGWRHNKPSLGLSPTFLRKMRKEFAEAEGQDLVISMSFLPWEGMLDLDTIKCVMSILKWLLWGVESSNYLCKETCVSLKFSFHSQP